MPVGLAVAVAVGVAVAVAVATGVAVAVALAVGVAVAVAMGEAVAVAVGVGVGGGLDTLRLKDTMAETPQLSVIRIVIVCVPAGAALVIETTPAAFTEMPPV